MGINYSRVAKYYFYISIQIIMIHACKGAPIAPTTAIFLHDLEAALNETTNMHVFWSFV